MAIYFADLKLTEVTVDATDSDTQITVSDAGLYSSGDEIIHKPSGTVMTVDSVDDVGNVITLTDATGVAMSTGDIITVDDSANDGTSVSAAKRTTIYINGTDKDNPSTVWVKRNSTMILDENSPVFQWGKIIFWPKQGEPFYDERPQDGIDAGWDDEEATGTIDMRTFSSMHNDADDVDFSIVNADMIIGRSADATPMFYTKNGVINIVNSKIECERTNYNNGSVFRIDEGGLGGINIHIDNTFVNSPDAGIMAMYNTVSWDKVKNLYIENGSEVHSNYMIPAISTKYRDYQGWNSLIVTDSKVVCTESLIYHKSYSGYFNGYNSFYMRNATARSKYFHKNASTDGSYGHNPLKVDIDKSSIESTSDMFYMHHRNAGGHEQNGYEEWKITNSNIKVAGTLFYYYKQDYMNIRQMKPLIVKNCEIDISGNVLYSDNASAFNKIIFRDNNILNLGHLFWSDIAFDDYSEINIRDSHINGDLMTGGARMNVDIRNVSIGGKLTQSGPYISWGETITAENISCYGFEGKGTYNISNSLIDTQSEADPFPNMQYGVLKNVNVVCYGSQILSGENARAVIIDSRIDGDIKTQYHSDVDVFNTESNSQLIPYYGRSRKMAKEVTASFRVGGSENAIMIKTLFDDSYGRQLIIDDISWVIDENSTKSTMYFATNATKEAMDEQKSMVAYTSDSNGDIVRLEGNIMQDQTSQWNGLPVDIDRYYVEFDTSSIANGLSEDRVLKLDFIYRVPNGELPARIYIDTDVKNGN